MYGQRFEDINLGPNDTYGLDMAPNDQLVEVNMYDEGKVNAYFFTAEPPKNVVVSWSLNDSILLKNTEYYYYPFNLDNGESVAANWSVEDGNQFNFYVIKGDEQFTNFEDDVEFTAMFEHIGTNGNYMLNVTELDNYYFVFWNTNNEDTYDVEFDIKLINYNLTTAVAMKSAPFTYNVAGLGYTFVVFVNPSLGVMTAFNYNISDDTASYGPIIFGAIVIVVIVLIVAFVVIRKKHSGAPGNQPTGMQPGQPGMQGQPGQQWQPNQPRSSYPQYNAGRPSDGGQSNMPPPQQDMYGPDSSTVMPNTGNKPPKLVITSGGQTIRPPVGGVGAAPAPASASDPGRICPMCGTELDPESLLQLNNTGSVFCKFCGAKNTK